MLELFLIAIKERNPIMLNLVEKYVQNSLFPEPMDEDAQRIQAVFLEIITDLKTETEEPQW